MNTKQTTQSLDQKSMPPPTNSMLSTQYIQTTSQIAAVEWQIRALEQKRKKYQEKIVTIMKEKSDLESWLAQAKQWQSFQTSGDKADPSHSRGKKKLGK